MRWLPMLLVLLTGLVGLDDVARSQPPAGGTEPGEPQHAGRTLSEWGELLTGDKGFAQADAANALGRMGPAAKAALPALREMAARDEAWVRPAASLAVRRIAGE